MFVSEIYEADGMLLNLADWMTTETVHPAMGYRSWEPVKSGINFREQLPIYSCSFILCPAVMNGGNYSGRIWMIYGYFSL